MSEQQIVKNNDFPISDGWSKTILRRCHLRLSWATNDFVECKYIPILFYYVISIKDSKQVFNRSECIVKNNLVLSLWKHQKWCKSLKIKMYQGIPIKAQFVEKVFSHVFFLS